MQFRNLRIGQKWFYDNKNLFLRPLYRDTFATLLFLSGLRFVKNTIKKRFFEIFLFFGQFTLKSTLHPQKVATTQNKNSFLNLVIVLITLAPCRTMQSCKVPLRITLVTCVLSRHSQKFELDGLQWKPKLNWLSRVENPITSFQKHKFRQIFFNKLWTVVYLQQIELLT